ncbi:H-type lectin domain-containing protein [Pseudaestuariivita sp.]|uniref:H-type lectin domain-containing protein n=1 Tax=Pseudaestuariivita sp. TaxID=2211669 RepID=UPI004058D940
MKKFSGRDIVIDDGRVDLFSDFEEGGPMWTGSGPRERRRKIIFAEGFDAPPMVHVGIALWDMDNRTNLRVDVRAENVEHDRFDVVFRTWGDTRVARVHVNWLAIGSQRNSDDWDVE